MTEAQKLLSLIRMTHSVEVPINIGDTVYVARAWSYGEHRVPCPVCYGKLAVVLELGNGERMSVECDGCGHGYSGPQGWVNEPCAGSSVDAGIVTGLATRGDEWMVTVGDSSTLQWGDDAFATEAEAEARRVVLYDEAVKDAADRALTIAAHKRKSVTWNVRYHRDRLKKAQHDAEYHQRKLSDALARQRKPTTPTETPS